MLQPSVLQNLSLNCKSTEPKNVTHFMNVKGSKANTSGKLYDTYETTLFCTFWIYLIPKSVSEVFIADLYVVLSS